VATHASFDPIITPARNQKARRIAIIASVACLAAGITASVPQPAGARHVTPPPVPPEVRVPSGNIAFLEGHAAGTQNYICLPSDGGFKFVLFTPQATLFDGLDEQVITRFFSPNPFEDGKVRATWQHSKDTSIVWGGTAIPPPTRNSSRRMPFPGSCFQRPVFKPGRRAVTP
jgi:hypothetical protein